MIFKTHQEQLFIKIFYFPKAKSDKWSSSETTLPTNVSKNEFDKNPVLDRFNHQLKTSDINTLNTMKPNFNWACTNIDNIKNNYDLEKYIILFPFCSAHLEIKKWPYFNELIELIKKDLTINIKLLWHQVLQRLMMQKVLMQYQY